jgi:hypothetical protein
MSTTQRLFIVSAASAAVTLVRYKSYANVKHFQPREVGQAEKMNLLFMARLDFLREVTGVPIDVNEAYATDGHQDDPPSFHYSGMAADIVIRHYSLEEMFQWAILCGFTGVGIYPHWNTPGIHVDIRPIVDRVATWMRNEHGAAVAIPRHYEKYLLAA